jgi:hypothetical protein
MPLGAFRLNGLAKSSSSSPTFVLNSDSFADNLQLAMPFNEITGLDDIGHLFTNSSTSQAAVRAGPSNSTYASIQTAQSKFYGSSYQQAAGGGGTNKLIYSLNDLWQPDAEDFTLEFWANTTRTNYTSWLLSNNDFGGRMLVGLYVDGSSQYNINLGDYRIRITTGWHHIAIQNNYWWIDGIRRGNVSVPGVGAMRDFYLGHQKNGDPNDWEGYMNDFRLYVGVNKYGSAYSFTVPGPMGVIG